MGDHLPDGGTLRRQALINRVRGARRDQSLAVLEGLHPIKHALRFGADIQLLVVDDRDSVSALAAQLAPDVADRLMARAQLIDRATFGQLVPRPPRTGVVAVAARPAVDLDRLLGRCGGPVVLLERPRRLDNVGACVRVAAAADAAGVLCIGSADPWHPDALRGAAGLHFALPVARIDHPPPTCGRPLIAVDPDGDPLTGDALPHNAILAFGTEREGLSRDLCERADRRVRLPMRQGVSSLNLATAVAALLYSQQVLSHG